MFNEVALEAWLTIDSCYLIGWNQKNPRGDHGLNEHAHSDRDPRRDPRGDCGQNDMLGFNTTGPTRHDPRRFPRGDHGEWGRCLMCLIRISILPVYNFFQVPPNTLKILYSGPHVPIT